jgi:glycosyltransferase involved in cell wall biosynthesis
VRTVLLIAYHFPPVLGSSGLQRTLRFAQYLPDFGWQPIVLSVEPSAYEQTDDRSLSQVPATCEVFRTRCFDAAKSLSFRGRYPAFAALPDRWASWQLWGVPAGRKLVKERNVEVLWSTYPIATAHKIGAAVARRTGLPWIADFRDPMAQEGYPPAPRQWRSFKRVEESAAAHAARMVFVSPSALEMYRQRYPQKPRDQFALLPNGFDESSFDGLTPRPRPPRPPMLLHSGIVYPEERDPTALFEALGRLSATGKIRPGDFTIRFRAAVHERLLSELASTHRVEPFIDIQPAIPYREALQEMLEADALMILQGASCNEQIPAKLYEYLRAGRPVLALADPIGDTGRTAKQLGLPFVTALESAQAIEQALPAFLAALRNGSLPIADRHSVDRYSRRTITGQLAALFDEVTREKA